MSSSRLRDYFFTAQQDGLPVKRSLSGLTALLAVLTFAVNGASGATAAQADSPAVVVSAPERWLDFDTRTPGVLALSSDGQRAVVTSDCQTMLYDLPSKNKLHIWDQRFAAASFSGNGRILLTRSATSVAVWDVADCKLLRRFTIRRPAWNEPGYQEYSTLVAAVSSDGREVAIANDHRQFDLAAPEAVLVYDVATGERHQTLLRPTKGYIDSLTFVPNIPSRLLVGYRDSGNVLWDIKTNEMIRELPDSMVRISDDGHQLASRCAQGYNKWLGDPTKIAIWDTDTGKLSQTLKYDRSLVAFALSPDSRRILASVSHRVIERDLDSGKTVFASDESSKPYSDVTYSPDGSRRFATTTEPNGVDEDQDYRLCGWTVTTNTKLPIRDYVFHSSGCSEDIFFSRSLGQFSFFPKGDRFIRLGDPFAVQDALTGDTVQTLPAYRFSATSVTFMPDGKNILVGAEGGGFVPAHLANVVSGKVRDWHVPRGRPPKLVFASNGRLLFTCDNMALYLIDVISSKIVWSLPLTLNSERHDAAISPDGQRIVVSQEAGWPSHSPSTSRLLLIEASAPDNLKAIEWYVSAVAFRPDGKRFLAAAPDAIYECDARSADRIRKIAQIPGRAINLMYSPDGQQVLACGVVGHRDPREPVNRDDNGWAMLWDATTGKSISLKGHTGPVTTAAFGPAGQRCATGSLDRTLQLWVTSTGRLLGIFSGHAGGINQIAYSPNGDRILTAAQDGAALWNVAPFASQPVESSQIAASFTGVESINALNATFGVPNKPSGAFLPIPPDYKPAAILVSNDWALLEIGKVGRDYLSIYLKEWLSQANTRQQLAPLMDQERPPYYPGYQLSDESRDGRHKLYVCSSERKVALRDGMGQLLQTWDTPRGFVQAVLSPSAKELVIAANTGRERDRSSYQIAIYNPGNGEKERVFHEDARWGIGSISVDPRDETMMYSRDASIVVRNFRTGDVIGTLKENPGGPALQAAYSPDGRFIATAKFPALVVNFYNRTTLQPCKTLSNLFPVRSFSFAPDGKRLLVRQHLGGDFFELATMWEIDTAQRLWSRCGYGAGRTVFSPDGSQFLIEPDVFHAFSVLWNAEKGAIHCVVLGPTPVFGSDGALRLGRLSGRILWPTQQ